MSFVTQELQRWARSRKRIIKYNSAQLSVNNSSYSGTMFCLCCYIRSDERCTRWDITASPVMTYYTAQCRMPNSSIRPFRSPTFTRFKISQLTPLWVLFFFPVAELPHMVFTQTISLVEKAYGSHNIKAYYRTGRHDEPENLISEQITRQSPCDLSCPDIFSSLGGCELRGSEIAALAPTSYSLQALTRDRGIRWYSLWVT